MGRAPCSPPATSTSDVAGPTSLVSSSEHQRQHHQRHHQQQSTCASPPLSYPTHGLHRCRPHAGSPRVPASSWLLLLLPLFLLPSLTAAATNLPLLELDLRQLRQAVAATGYAGDTNSTSSSSSSTSTPTTTASAPSATGGPTTSTTTTHAGGQYEKPGSPQELTDCINNHQPNSNGTSWTSAMHDEWPYFKVVGMWWSRKPADVPLTITTQLSWNRKWQLKAMCRSWGGPIAAVMHMPVLLPQLTHRKNARLSDVSNKTLHRAIEVVAAFHARMDKSHPCKLDLMLLAEPYKDGKSLVLYPVNTLRNYARLMARTPLIGIVDVDLIVSASLRKELLDSAAAAKYVAEADAAVAAVAAGRWGPQYATGRSRLSGSLDIADEKNLTMRLEGPRAAYVLPAFATRGGSLEEQVERAEKLLAVPKAELLPYYRQAKLMRFDWGSTGHVNTNYEAWFQASQPYLAEWSDRYEPWLFVDRLSSSWADARFRGYGKNKISHIRTLAYEGYELRVHPQAFLIHRPHLQSSSSNAHLRSAMYGKKSKRSSMYGHNLYLYEGLTRSMAYGKYAPLVDPATEVCRKKLSWWTGGAANL